jgi:hypothetical protein
MRRVNPNALHNQSIAPPMSGYANSGITMLGGIDRLESIESIISSRGKGDLFRAHWVPQSSIAATKTGPTWASAADQGVRPTNRRRLQRVSGLVVHLSRSNACGPENEHFLGHGTSLTAFVCIT